MNVTLPDLPPDACLLLDRVVEHHRDRDEPPIQFRLRYVLPDCTAPMQGEYDRAIKTLAAAVAALPDGDRNRLDALVGHLNDEGHLPNSARTAVARLSQGERVAHAWAGAYIRSCYFDLRQYLDPGVPATSRVLTCYPELARILTGKDFLLPVGGVVVPGHAWLTYKRDHIHPHPCLRRGFTSKVNSELLGQLWNQLGKGLSVSVAIDHFRMCPRGELGQLMELDYWFGAPFKAGKLDDKHAVGATLHARVKDVSPFEKAGLLTEFRWSFSDGLKTFEVEELPTPSDVDRPVICRYVHAIRDVSLKRFVHLDGAALIYDRVTYGERYRQAIEHRLAKVWAPRKVKLFRIDELQPKSGSGIDAEHWSSIVISFFRENELVLEYFDGRPFAEVYRERYGREHPWLGRSDE